jgi:lysozyme family protein
MARFKPAVTATITREGGDAITRDRHDPGGTTRWGISQRAFPDVDVAELTRTEAEAIYRSHYWEPVQGNGIRSQPVAEALFDTAVNMGVDRGVKIAQQVLGVSMDGDVGPVTLKALNRADAHRFLTRFALEKVRYYALICTARTPLKRYLLGWVNRALDTAPGPNRKTV